MTFDELIRDRCSVRDYSDKLIPEDVLNSILEAGRCAPTARNGQPQHIYVLKSEDAVKKIRELSSCAFNAPLVLMICEDTSRRSIGRMTGKDLSLYDAAIVCTHMMLKAWDAGVGSCWVCYFDPEASKKAFHLPENMEPLFLLLLGYAADGYVPGENHGKRLPLSETVTEL